MNCKAGDMAVIISGLNAGKIVTCIKLIGDTGVFNILENGPVWEVDTPVRWKAQLTDDFIELALCPDRALMPIQPSNDVKDEVHDEAIADVEG